MRTRSVARLRVHKNSSERKEMSARRRSRRNAFYSSSVSHRDTRNLSRLTLSGRRKSRLEEPEQGLTTKQVEAFREVFSLFDINGGGTIDAQELNSALGSVDIHLSRGEIEEVLRVMDEDGNGEIDFEEFLALMTSTEKYLEALGGPEHDQKEGLLFSALTKFMRKSALSSLTEIERYYNAKARKSPHVVGHYAAGARLIGLTEKQMAQHLVTLSASGDENSDSPYAQPVCMFTSAIPGKIINRHRNGKIKLTFINKEEAAEKQDKEKGEERSTHSHLEPAEDNAGLQKPLSAGAAAANPAKRRQQHHLKPSHHLRPQISVKLPAISMRKLQKNPNLLTIEDLPTIRSQVQMAYSRFYSKQDSRSKKLRHAFADLSTMPKYLQSQFLFILNAYNFTPVNVPPELRLHLEQRQSWQLPDLSFRPLSL